MKLAPEWATHYFIDVDDDAIYESINFCWWKSLDSPMYSQRLDDGARLIPKKPFDFESYKFSDSIANVKAKVNAQSTITLDVFDKWIMVNRDDVAAMAKVLGMTGEDLK